MGDLIGCREGRLYVLGKGGTYEILVDGRMLCSGPWILVSLKWVLVGVQMGLYEDRVD